MYCSSCGGAVARALTYCNHCGAKLFDAKDDDQLVKGADQYVQALAFSTIGGLAVGLGCIIGLIAVMKEVAHLDMPWIISFTIASFVLVFAVEGVLISQLLRHQRRGRGALDEKRSLSRPNTKELESSPPRALPDPIPSVTEHTTRAFEPLFPERKAK